MNKKKNGTANSEERLLVAREAAMLLYKGLAEEYKQAKIMANENLLVKTFPSNYEIAIELDRIADEMEGDSRKELISKMRRGALELMCLLKEFNPRLTGSVWRGTARAGSDIDIIVYSFDPNEVVRILKSNNYEIHEDRWIKVDFNNMKKAFFNLKTILKNNSEAEITVRGLDDFGIDEKCEIYGDSRKGYSMMQLRNVLKKNALKKCIPSKKS
ncbi:nucleotidyltransferase domain-containing protein [Candidatus Pacearchaeota archaeon]|nr:nucleotidyltransferase domain-containing protein [Candidatus Pacearchaeota archaeon]